MLAKATYTTVINTSGGSKLFSFLPPHGLMLDQGQSITLIGEIHVRLIPGWPYHSDRDRPPHRSKIRALQQAQDAKQLLIIRSSQPVRNEELTLAFHKLGALGIPDPYLVQRKD